MDGENNSAVSTKWDGETTGEALDALRAILAEMRDDRIIRLNGEDVTRCMLHNLADRIEAAAERVKVAIEQERRQLRSLVARFANCHEDNEDFGALLREARFVLDDTPFAVVDGKPVAVLHGRVAQAPDGRTFIVNRPEGGEVGRG